MHMDTDKQTEVATTDHLFTDVAGTLLTTMQKRGLLGTGIYFGDSTKDAQDALAEALEACNVKIVHK